MSGSGAVRNLNTIQLVDVVVAQIDARLRLPAGESEEASNGEAVIDWNLHPDIAYRLTGPTTLEIRVEASLRYGVASPRPFDLSVALVGHYHSSDVIDEERIAEVLETHSLPLLWPYLRELISDLTTRMGGPVIVIPTLSVRIAVPIPDVAETTPKRRPSGKRSQSRNLAAPKTDEHRT